MDATITICLTIIPIILTPMIYIVRTFMHRIDILEEKISNKITEEEVRLLLSDKLEPVQTNLRDIKTSLDSLTAHILLLRKD